MDHNSTLQCDPVYDQLYVNMCTTGSLPTARVLQTEQRWCHISRKDDRSLLISSCSHFKEGGDLSALQKGDNQIPQFETIQSD